MEPIGTTSTFDGVSVEHPERPLALVVGAGGGIGLEVAKELARRDYDLVVCDTDLSSSERVISALGRGSVITCQANLATGAGMRSLTQGIAQLGRTLAAAVICAQSTRLVRSTARQTLPLMDEGGQAMLIGPELAALEELCSELGRSGIHASAMVAPPVNASSAKTALQLMAVGASSGMTMAMSAPSGQGASATNWKVQG